MKYYLGAFKKYFELTGRASKTEFWYFVLFNIMFSITAMLLDEILGMETVAQRYGLIYTIYTAIVFTPGLTIVVRRLHDVGKSGFFVFIILIPIIGLIWLLIVLAGNGYPGKNKYGENPNKKQKF